MNRSDFTDAKGYMIDRFPELANLPPVMYKKADRLVFLRAKDNRTEEENVEMNQIHLELENYSVSPETWNKFCDCLINMQEYLRDKVFDHVNQMREDIRTFSEAMKLDVKTYVDNKKIEFQAEIDKFDDKGIYNPTLPYYKNNFVRFTENIEEHIYLCIKNCQGISPLDSIHWRKLTIKGDRGLRGENGVGLKPQGVWSREGNYAKDDMVFHKGMMFASLIDGNTGQEPDVTMDTLYWAKAFNATVTTTHLEGIRTIVSNVTEVDFRVGNINAFNPDTDSLVVIKNRTILKRGEDYEINLDNRTIYNLKGVWDGTKDYIKFHFMVTRNQINNLVFSDGQAIKHGTITLDRLAIDIQEKINKIDTIESNVKDNEDKIGILSNLKTTFKANLVGAINEIKDDVTTQKADIGTAVLTTTSKTIKGAINEVNTNVTNSNNNKTDKNDYVANNGYASTGGTSTAYTATLSPAPTAYKDGMTITIKPHADCGANPTLNVNSLGATPLCDNEGNRLNAGDLVAGRPYSFVRVGSNFFLASGSKYKKGDVKLDIEDYFNIKSNLIAILDEGVWVYTGNNTAKLVDKNETVLKIITFSSDVNARVIAVLEDAIVWTCGRATSQDLSITNKDGTLIKLISYTYGSSGGNYGGFYAGLVSLKRKRIFASSYNNESSEYFVFNTDGTLISRSGWNAGLYIPSSLTKQGCVFNSGNNYFFVSDNGTISSTIKFYSGIKNIFR